MNIFKGWWAFWVTFFIISICIKDLKVNVVCPKYLLCAMQMQFSYRVNDHNIVCVYGSQRTVPQCGENIS